MRRISGTPFFASNPPVFNSARAFRSPGINLAARLTSKYANLEFRSTSADATTWSSAKFRDDFYEYPKNVLRVVNGAFRDAIRAKFDDCVVLAVARKLARAMSSDRG